MFKPIFILIGIFTLLSCSHEKKPGSNMEREINPEFTEISIHSSIRAIEIINDHTVWFAGSKGMFGYTKDGGITWHIDSIQVGENRLEFRSIAHTNDALLLLNVSSPAYVLRSVDDGKNWSIVYQEDHLATFYNSMKFWDDKTGIAVGDPIDGCLSVIITRDAGITWEKLDCTHLPPTYAGEAGFAASNTNIAVCGDHTWVATGGQKARVFYSPNRGYSWEVFDTPMLQGGKMTGIFSIDFQDERHGIIFGGDWEDQANTRGNKAVTSDGGKTWRLLHEGAKPGYRSCVQYIPNTPSRQIIAVGIPGISFTNNNGQSWQHINKTDFYTIRVNQTGNMAWMAGKNKIAKMEW